MSNTTINRVQELRNRLVNKTKYNRYLAKYCDEHDILELINDFEQKYKRFPNKDIYQYTIEDLRITLKLSKPTIIEIKKTGATKIFENEKVKVYEITTPEASCYYGSNTKWCISAKNNNLFDSYYREHNIYFILSKKLPKTDSLHKVAVLVDSTNKTTLYNSLDEEINITDKSAFNIQDQIFKVPTEQDLINRFLNTLEYDSDQNIVGNVCIPRFLVKNGKLIIDFRTKIVTGGFNCSWTQLTTLEGCPESVVGVFDCSGNQLTSLKHCPQSVGGGFHCHTNQLTTLKHCPESVSGGFGCSGNQLTSLKHCPQSVGGGFHCHTNQLTTLKHCPESVGDVFDCSMNKLTSLKHCPQSVGGDFYCSNNQLSTLEHCPESVGGFFDCSGNQLTTLKYCPKTVGSYFSCSDNQLTTLKGSPQSVGGNFNCSDNQLTTLKGSPKSVGGVFFCQNNKKQLTEEEVKALCNVKGLIYV